MNKTININLAGMFFYIDEDAFLKLQRYLETIKRSFTNSQGRDEIIADIEARIAELFSDRMVNERQVISVNDVNEIITIMGQPEDYMVDEEIFEDEPATRTRKSSNKQLLRDPDNKYIAGVSSGLGYYLGVDSVWIRLLWIILVIAFVGTPILVYIILWIVMPEAKTTAQKLAMRGEAVNISNIEKKVREGFDGVAERVKNVDYEKMSRNVKDSSQTFFEALGNVILSILKVIAKLAGIFVILVSSVILIGLLISLFALGSSSFIKIPAVEYLSTYFLETNFLWLFAILTFFAVGIPVFFLFILGLKIVANNVKSIGNVAKYSLLAVWIISILGLIFIGLQKAAENSTESTSTERMEVMVSPYDTLFVTKAEDKMFNATFTTNGIDFVEDEGVKKAFVRNRIHFMIKPTRDSISYIKVEKLSNGSSLENANEHARNIEYTYSFSNNILKLNEYLLTDFGSGYRNQRVYVTLYIPAGTLVVLDKSVGNIVYAMHNDHDIYDYDMPEYKWMMGKDELKCLDCPEDTNELSETETEEVSEDEQIIEVEKQTGKADNAPALLEVQKLKTADSID